MMALKKSNKILKNQKKNLKIVSSDLPNNINSSNPISKNKCGLSSLGLEELLNLLKLS